MTTEDKITAGNPEPSAVNELAGERKTFEQQASEDGGRTWRTVAAGLDAADVTGARERDAAGEGRRWRFLPETDNGLARLVAAKEAQLVATRNEFAANADRTVGGRPRTKQFGRRVDAQLRRAGQLHREAERLESEIRGLRRRATEPEPAPLDLDRLPYAKAIRTGTGWYRVLKVNRVSVTVEVPPGWDNRIPLRRIREIREHADAPAPAAEPTPAAAPSALRHPVEGRGCANAEAAAQLVAAPPSRTLVARRVPEVGAAVFDARTDEKVYPTGDRWLPNLRAARAKCAELTGADMAERLEKARGIIAEELAAYEAATGAASTGLDGEVISGPHAPIGSVRVCDVGGEQLDGPWFLVSAGTANDWTADRGASCPTHCNQPVPTPEDVTPFPRAGAPTGYAAAVEAATERPDDTWTERFSAGWSDGEVTVIRDVRAGISGPFGEYPAGDLAEAEAVLRTNGYALSGPWAEHANGYFAPLVRVPVDSVPPWLVVRRTASGRSAYVVHSGPADGPRSASRPVRGDAGTVRVEYLTADGRQVGDYGWEDPATLAPALAVEPGAAEPFVSGWAALAPASV